MKELKFFKRFIHTMIKGDNLNWHERNSGNMTYRLKKEEIQEASKFFVSNPREYEIGQEIKEIASEYFLVTGSGKYFMNVIIDTNEVIGVIKICENGKKYKIVYGFENGAMPTSELPAHLLIQAKIKINNEADRTVYHCHPTHINIMTYVSEYDSYKFSAQLWKCATEASVFVPKGVALLKWMMAGSIEIGQATSDLLTEFNIVCWVHHGVFAVGEQTDETLGMVHVAEKSAEIFCKINSMNLPLVNTIKKEEIIDLITTFGIEANSKVIEAL